jgi:hypothetical protein
MIRTAKGTYQDGQVVLDEPVDWPDGTCVEVRLAERPISQDGITSDPDIIAAMLERLD